MECYCQILLSLLVVLNSIETSESYFKGDRYNWKKGSWLEKKNLLNSKCNLSYTSNGKLKKKTLNIKKYDLSFICCVGWMFNTHNVLRTKSISRRRKICQLFWICMCFVTTAILQMYRVQIYFISLSCPCKTLFLHFWVALLK